MHPHTKTPILATAFLLGLALTACQNEPTASNEADAKGGLALAFSARALAQMQPSADSLHLRLVGARDTVQSISRLGDTVRFDGLRVGTWSIDAQVYANDSGTRQVAWVGSAATNVEPGRVARVPLMLRKPTGSIIVEIDIDDGTIDTPVVIAPHDTTDMIPPIGIEPIDTPDWNDPFIDTPAVLPPSGTIARINPADSAKWPLDANQYLFVPRYDTSSAWIRGSVLLLGTKLGPNGLIARVAVRGGGNAVDGILSPVYDRCGDTSVDTLCLPYTIQLVGRPSSRLTGSIDDSTRIVETVIALGKLRDRQIVLRDDYGTTRIEEGLWQDKSRCEIVQGGKGLCHDASGFQTSYLAPFEF